MPCHKIIGAWHYATYEGMRRDHMVMISRMRSVWTILGILIGFYLTLVHYASAPVACPVTAVINCVAVLHSAGSMLGPLPLALWGVMWIMVARVLPRKLRSWLWMPLGMGGIVWAVGHEWALGQICLWCSALQVDMLLLMVAWWRQDKSRIERSGSHLCPDANA